MADLNKQAWMLFEWRRLGEVVDDPAGFIQEKTRQYNAFKFSDADKSNLAAATAAIISAETSVRIWKERLPDDLPTNPRGELETSAGFKSVTAYHKACVSLRIALFSLLKMQKRLNLDPETQDWTLEWYKKVSENCKSAQRDLAKITDSQDFVDAIPTGTHWTGGWSIGYGMFANVYLYIRHDDNGMIDHRVVAKDNHYKRHSVWNHDSFWSTTPSGDRIPNEVKAMFDLRGKHGSDFIVKILNWRISMEARFYRIYTEYLPLGDCLEILDAQDETKELVPEPFLWHMFECLAIAGLLMEHGELQRNPISTWQTIVHRDIKLENVWLDRPSKLKYGRYPTPKLGDFGAAVYISRDNPRKAEDYKIAGTPDCYPIEQDPQNAGGRTVSSKSNVWAVASTVGSLIWQSQGYNGLNYREDGVSEPSFTKSQTEAYSSQLRDLILHCMRYDQDDRPDLATLLRTIREAMKDGMDAGLRNEPATSDRWTARLLALGLEDKVNPIAQVHLDDDHESDCEIGGAAGTELLRRKEATPPRMNSSPGSPRSNPRSGSQLNKAFQSSVEKSPHGQRETRGEESQQPTEQPEGAKQHEPVAEERQTGQGEENGRDTQPGLNVPIDEDGQAGPDDQADNSTRVNQSEQIDQREPGNPSEGQAVAVAEQPPPASQGPAHQENQDEVNLQVPEEEQNIPEDQDALDEAEPAVAEKKQKKRKKVTETAASSRPKRHKPDNQR